MTTYTASTKLHSLREHLRCCALQVCMKEVLEIHCRLLPKLSELVWSIQYVFQRLSGPRSGHLNCTGASGSSSSQNRSWFNNNFMSDVIPHKSSALALETHPRIFNILHAIRLIPPFTATRPAELLCVAKYAAGANIAVEIGTFMGASAGVIASVLCPRGTLYCVDPYENGDALLAICVRHLRRRHLLDRIVMIRARSNEIGDQIPGRVDFIFVDGDHSRKGIETDWNVVRAKLRPGGVACFHDTSPPPETSHKSCESERFFHDVIKSDTGFKHLETCFTLNVIQRIDT
jgi:predicted O-methyltransferase YrrM